VAGVVRRVRPDLHPAVLAELGVGHVDAVVAHALGELEQALLHLGLLLGVELDRAHAVLEDRLALRLRRLELLRLGVHSGATLSLVDEDAAAAVLADLRVGHVDAVVAHALGEVEQRLLAVFRCRLGPAGVVVCRVGRRRWVVEAGDLGGGVVVASPARGQRAGGEQDHCRVPDLHPVLHVVGVRDRRCRDRAESTVRAAERTLRRTNG
jgi:hypothetical protein